jgi:hypothetical protein
VTGRGVDALDRHADLPAVAERRPEQPVRDLLHVDVVQQDGGVVAAQFEGDPRERGRRARGDRPGYFFAPTILAVVPAATPRPVAAEPVKVTWRIPGCEARRAPRGSRPVTIVSTPSGRAPERTDPSNRVARGVNGEGLSTIVLPAARAGANFADASCRGKFHGTIAATGPSGRQRTSLCTGRPSVIGSVPASSPAK